MMDLWVSKAMSHDMVLTGDVLHSKWTAFADLLNILKDERLNLSDRWLGKFKNCAGLKCFKRHGKAGSVDPEVVEKEKEHIQELVQIYGYKLHDIFNMDETGLFYV